MRLGLLYLIILLGLHSCKKDSHEFEERYVEQHVKVRGRILLQCDSSAAAHIKMQLVCVGRGGILDTVRTDSLGYYEFDGVYKLYLLRNESTYSPEPNDFDISFAPHSSSSNNQPFSFYLPNPSSYLRLSSFEEDTLNFTITRNNIHKVKIVFRDSNSGINSYAEFDVCKTYEHPEYWYMSNCIENYRDSINFDHGLVGYTRFDYVVSTNNVQNYYTDSIYCECNKDSTYIFYR